MMLGYQTPIRFLCFFFCTFCFYPTDRAQIRKAFEAKRKKSAVDEVSFVSHRSILFSDSKVELHAE